MTDIDAAHDEAIFFDSLPEGDDTPNQCHECGAYNVDRATWQQVEVDLDPGNAEVGPDPYLCTVSVCPACAVRS